MILVFLREIHQSDSVFGKLSESQQRLFEVFSFLLRLVDIMESLACVDLILQASAHDFLSNFLNAVNEETLKLVAVHAVVRHC